MSNYLSDREFTDFVHKRLVREKMNVVLGVKEIDVDEKELRSIDMHKGIDYVFTDGEKNYTVQERMREIKYKNFNDFTIRFTRNHNPHSNRQKSEFFKIEADLFVYGIINCTKNEVQMVKDLDFIKFLIVDLHKLQKAFDEGKIVFLENASVSTIKNGGVIEDNKLYIPILKNKDASSEFIAINVNYILRLFKNENIIIYEEGFRK